MTTTPHTRRAAAGNRQRQGITTTPMQQVIPWVKIELQVRADLAAALNARPEIIRDGYGRDIFSPCIDIGDALDSGLTDGRAIRSARHLAEAFGDLDGYDTAPFAVVMQESWWIRVQAAADGLCIPIGSLVRGLLFKRWLGLKQADKRPPMRDEIETARPGSTRSVHFYLTTEETDRWNRAAMADGRSQMADYARRVIEAAAKAPEPPKLDGSLSAERRPCVNPFRIGADAWFTARDRAEALGLDVNQWARRVLLGALAGTSSLAKA